MSDSDKALAALKLMALERIGVLPADSPRFDWCGYMTRRRVGVKGSECWTAYRNTPIEAILAVWAQYQHDRPERDKPAPNPPPRSANGLEGRD